MFRVVVFVVLALVEVLLRVCCCVLLCVVFWAGWFFVFDCRRLFVRGVGFACVFARWSVCVARVPRAPCMLSCRFPLVESFLLFVVW